jgi:hypothetical protein
MRLFAKLLGMFKTNPKCECGNPQSCQTHKLKLFVLLDIVDTGPLTSKFVLNKERAARCIYSIYYRGKNNG